MDKATKLFLNSLKCPVCDSLIDMYDGRSAKPATGYNFACVADNYHYRLIIMPDSITSLPFLIEERVCVYGEKHMYAIKQNETTNISIYGIDGDKNVTALPAHPLSFDKKIFDFTKTNKEKLLNKIKTILVFQ